MSVIKCNNGHFYESEQYLACPFCGGHGSIENENLTDVFDDLDVHSKLTVMDGISNDRELAKQLTQHYLEEVEENDKTIGLFFNAEGVQPVVGWLVCEDGPERGNSYKIVSGRNFIGRSHKSDIVIYDDQSISREKHCSVIFEPKTCNFYVMPSEQTITLLNGDTLTDAVCITDDDVISIGKSKFRMIPYCKKGREWD